MLKTGSITLEVLWSCRWDAKVAARTEDVPVNMQKAVRCGNMYFWRRIVRPGAGICNERTEGIKDDLQGFDLST